MQKFNGSLIRQFSSLTTGNAAAGVQVSVFISGTNTLATLYSANVISASQLDNPLTTDGKGFYSFYAEDGRYRLEFSNGYPALEVQLVDVIDINTEFNAAISGLESTVDTLTLTVAGDFDAGASVTARNQVVLWPISAGGDGREYRWAGTLPKVVPPASTPASTGGISDSAWVYTVNVALEQALLNGTANIGGKTAQQIADYPDELAAANSDKLISGKQAQYIVSDQEFSGVNNTGGAISGVKNQVQFLTDKTDRSLKSGVYLTPDIGHRAGQLAYRKINGKAELITNLDRFKPYWFYMSPEAAQEHGLNVYYVSKAGNDSNDGLSWATALRTITAAFNKNSSNADYIAVRAGHYGLTDGFAKRTITKNLVMKAVGGDVIISNQRLVTWADNGNGTHTSNALGGTPLPVLSPLYVDEFGDFIRFTLVGTLADVAVTPYSRFVSGTGVSQVVTINLNGVTPTDNNVFVPRAQDLGFGFNNAALKLHIEGFQFIMGQNAACRVNNGTINSVFSAKNCWFRNSFNTDDLEVLDIGTVILEDCRASAGDKDGFNYHEGVNAVPIHAVEINCTGINHRRTEGTANGSTLHEACKAIRIGGTYGWGWGPGVADINDSQAVNVGCVSNGGRLYTNAKGFQNEGNSIGYYDGCVSGGNTSVSDPNLAALSVENSGAIAYVSTDNNFDIIETSGGGQVLTYTPDGSL